MKLFLTSSGITNPTLAKALMALVGKRSGDTRLTFIPTAANVEKEDTTWVETDIQNLRDLGFADCDVVDISAVSENRWQESFRHADLLCFGGGNLTYLLEWLHRSGVAQVLPEFLRTKVYMGISAGSMVTAKTVSFTSANILYYEQTGILPSTPGLGFVDFEIRPHLNSPQFPKVTIAYLETIEKHIPYVCYAIDDNTAVRVVDKAVSVVSEGVWKKLHESSV